VYSPNSCMAVSLQNWLLYPGLLELSGGGGSILNWRPAVVAVSDIALTLSGPGYVGLPPQGTVLAADLVTVCPCRQKPLCASNVPEADPANADPVPIENRLYASVIHQDVD